MASRAAPSGGAVGAAAVRGSRRLLLLAIAVAALTIAVVVVRGVFERDLARAAARAAEGSKVVATACGPIEVQEAGAGVPLLMIHGSGGGHDQGMAFAQPLAARGMRVIAPSRFGYLRTPMPADPSPQAQADAHRCLLDALGVARAVVLGVSAGAASALETAIRHPERVRALALVVPIAYRPPEAGDVVEPMPPIVERTMLTLLGSDFLFWSALRVARDQVIRYPLATPPEQVAAASALDRARVDELLERILPVSRRAAGLRDDSTLGRRLGPAALDAVRAPTLVVSARDDGYGTYASARYVAARIAGAELLGFEDGGHLLVGHNDAVLDAIARLAARPDGPTGAP